VTPPEEPIAAVRRARARDAGEVARLYAQLVSNPALDVLPERLAELETSADAALFVVDRGDRLAGTVLVCLCLDAMFGRRPFAVVENIVVDAGLRGRGVGARLLRQVERFCLAADCSKIMLLSAAERSDAHAFFERLGYAGDRKRGFVKYRSAFGGMQ
jgi:GNAT superfamily N-acetyltransferase